MSAQKQNIMYSKRCILMQKSKCDSQSLKNNVAYSPRCSVKHASCQESSALLDIPESFKDTETPPEPPLVAAREAIAPDHPLVAHSKATTPELTLPPGFGDQVIALPPEFEDHVIAPPPVFQDHLKDKAKHRD